MVRSNDPIEVLINIIKIVSIGIIGFIIIKALLSVA